MALVALSVVDLRLDAVRAVLEGAPVSDVAVRFGVSRQSVHGWIGRYFVGGDRWFDGSVASTGVVSASDGDQWTSIVVHVDDGAVDRGPGGPWR